jgi:hypothetical protein
MTATFSYPPTDMQQVRAKEVASTIWAQIRAAGWAVNGSWGARELVALLETDEARGGLRFRVSGRKHKGLVVVELMPSDTYRVRLLKKSRGAFVMTYEAENVYAECLANTIDLAVER